MREVGGFILTDAVSYQEFISFLLNQGYIVTIKPENKHLVVKFGEEDADE